MIDDFETMHLHCNKSDDTRHHDQTASTQISFTKNVQSLVAALEELGNPFKEESEDLQVLDTKEIVDHTAVKSGHSTH